MKKRSMSSMSSMDDSKAGVGGRTGRDARPTSQGNEKAKTQPLQGLSRNLGSRGSASALKSKTSSRPISKAEPRLNKNFALKFAYDLDSIILPECLCFFDFLSQRPVDKMDLRGWMVNKSLFRVVGETGRNNLQTLLLDESIGFTVQMFELIRGFQKLRILSLASTGMDITFQAAQILGSFPRLMELNISNCRVDITSFSILCNTCQNLRALTCQNCPGLDDYCLQALAACMQVCKPLSIVNLRDMAVYLSRRFQSILCSTLKSPHLFLSHPTVALASHIAMTLTFTLQPPYPPPSLPAYSGSGAYRALICPEGWNTVTKAFSLC